MSMHPTGPQAGRRRAGLVAVMSIALIAAVGAGCGDDSDDDGASSDGGVETSEVSLRLDWVAQGYQAPFYSALGEGYYEDEGLDVEIQDGRGTSATIKLVANGSDDFGFGQLSEMATAVADQEIPLQAVAGVFQQMPDAIFVREGTGITDPAGLVGKSVVSSPADSSREFFPALATANGFSADEVNFLDVGSESKTRTFVAGEGDAMLNFASDEFAVEDAGVSVELLRYADYGINVISQGIFTSDDFLAENPETVGAFVRASMKGLQFAIDNPEEAVAWNDEYRPGAEKPEQALSELEVSIPLIDPPGGEGDPLGFMPPEEWTASLELLNSVGQLENVPEASEVYTNEFVEDGGEG